MKLALIAGDSPDARAGKTLLEQIYGSIFHPPEVADIWVVLGGDGMMLETLHKAQGTLKKIFGMNCGTIGFLMNEFQADDLIQRIQAAHIHPFIPLKMVATTISGEQIQEVAFNEVSLLRQTGQAAHISIAVDDKERLPELICDGVMVSTPAGSTAYNMSVGGPILPLEAQLLALTPISAFRPRRWRGAILPQRSTLTFKMLDPINRPVSAVADFKEVRYVTHVTVTQAFTVTAYALFDKGHHLEERILREQFS